MRVPAVPAPEPRPGPDAVPNLWGGDLMMRSAAHRIGSPLNRVKHRLIRRPQLRLRDEPVLHRLGGFPLIPECALHRVSNTGMAKDAETRDCGSTTDEECPPINGRFPFVHAIGEPLLCGQAELIQDPQHLGVDGELVVNHPLGSTLAGLLAVESSLAEEPNPGTHGGSDDTDPYVQGEPLPCCDAPKAATL